MQELEGRTAVITGAAAGIGAAMARRFARAGMRVVLADRDLDGASELARELSGQGSDARPAAVDVTQPDSMEALARDVYRDFGAVHLLCNNAGVLGRIQPSWEQPLENWRWVFDVNLSGVVHGLHYFLPRMIDGGQEGYVLNTGSIAGLITGPFLAPYNASKHAVVALTECLQHELRAAGSTIQAGVLCPGWVNTGLADFQSKLPDGLRAVNSQVATHPAAAARDESVRGMVADSIGPDAIAETVESAVREGRFWVFPHPERKADIAARMQGIAEERTPGE